MRAVGLAAAVDRPRVEPRQPLGVSIVGGLLLSQLITLFIAPVLYLGFDSLGASRARPEPMSAISSQS